MSDETREPERLAFNAEPASPPELRVPAAPPPLTPPPAPRPRSSGPSLGTILLGAILILAGAGWLLQATGALDISLDAILPGALILIGAALILSAGRGGSGGLVAIGIILTVVLTVTSAVSVPLSGGVGDYVDHPRSLSDVRSEYRLIAGQRTLDLRDVSFPTGTTGIDIRHGIGQLTVYLPRDVAARVEFTVTAGQATVLSRILEGAFLEGSETTSDFATAQRRISLTIEHGIGQIEVRR